MNCIDAIEGTVKSILKRMLADVEAVPQGDTEYIREAKAILEATSIFVQQNPEISPDPQILGDVLYRYAKEQWMTLIRNQRSRQEETEPAEMNSEADTEYDGYLYDQLFHRENYPL